MFSSIRNYHNIWTGRFIFVRYFHGQYTRKEFAGNEIILWWNFWADDKFSICISFMRFISFFFRLSFLLFFHHFSSLFFFIEHEIYHRKFGYDRNLCEKMDGRGKDHSIERIRLRGDVGVDKLKNTHISAKYITITKFDIGVSIVLNLLSLRFVSFHYFLFLIFFSYLFAFANPRYNFNWTGYHFLLRCINKKSIYRHNKLAIDI